MPSDLAIPSWRSRTTEGLSHMTLQQGGRTQHPDSRPVPRRGVYGARGNRRYPTISWIERLENNPIPPSSRSREKPRRSHCGAAEQSIHRQLPGPAWSPVLRWHGRSNWVRRSCRRRTVRGNTREYSSKIGRDRSKAEDESNIAIVTGSPATSQFASSVASADGSGREINPRSQLRTLKASPTIPSHFRTLHPQEGAHSCEAAGIRHR